MDNKISQFWKETKKHSKKIYEDFWDHKKHPKKMDRWTSRFNSFLVVLIIAMLIFAGVWQLGGWIKGAIEDFIEDRLVSKLINTQELIFKDEPSEAGSRIDSGSSVETNGRLISSSFTDLFSGVGWINQDDTTLYHDRTVTAFSFPPSFEWLKIDEGSVDLENFVQKRDDGSDRRCIGSECLMQKDLSIYYSDEDVEDSEFGDYQIDIPEEVNSESLVNISIGSLESRWLVGFVEESDSGFSGRVYYFDGSQYQPVFDDAPFKSDYEGRIGFGGDNDDFLVVYGGYRGQGYHVMPSGEREDISEFLGIRLMGEGFHPEVIKGADGSWYIYSLTAGKTKFVKLYQNETDSIKGVVDLSDFVTVNGAENISFYQPDEDENILYARIDTSVGDSEYWRFVDQGFDKSRSQAVFSGNINNNPSEVREAGIVDIKMSEVGGDLSFYLSNNGRDWYEVDTNHTIEFPDQSGRQLFWKAEIEPDDNPKTTPFLDLIRLNYKLHFL